jgi:hypothetical protein
MKSQVGVLVSKKIKSPSMLWTDEETNRLEMFIVENRDQIMSNIQQNLKSIKTIKKDLFFKRMAESVQTRNPVQCKNKFYKLEKVILTDVLKLKESQFQEFQNKRVLKPGSISKKKDNNAKERMAESSLVKKTKETVAIWSDVEED